MIELKISFKHELYEEYDEKEKRKVVYYKRPLIMGGSRKFYKNRICVTGEDIDKIREVKYILPRIYKFPNPIRPGRDKNFELIFWAWARVGSMDIIVTDTDGDVHNYKHLLRLDELVKEAEAKKWTKEYEFEQTPL